MPQLTEAQFKAKTKYQGTQISENQDYE